MSFELWKENDSSYVKPLWPISLEGNINIIGLHMNSKWSSNKIMLPMTCFSWKRKYNYLFTNQDDFILDHEVLDGWMNEVFIKTLFYMTTNLQNFGIQKNCDECLLP
jgi:hypothetical protein